MNIKAVIKARGFTQVQVAKALGVTKSSLSQCVHNENTSIRMMKRIADVIGCKVGDFFLDEIELPQQKPTLVCPNCGEEFVIKIEGKNVAQDRMQENKQ